MADKRPDWLNSNSPEELGMDIDVPIPRGIDALFEEAQTAINVFPNEFEVIDEANFSCFKKNCEEGLISTKSSPHLAHVVSFKDIEKVVETFFKEGRHADLAQFVKYLTELDQSKELRQFTI